MDRRTGLDVATICGLATLGVAAVPLGSVSDGLHGRWR